MLRDGRVLGLIDFAEAAPGRPLWDLAIAAQEWAPLHAPGAGMHHPDRLDGVRRTALLAHAYGVEPEQAEELVDVVAQERVQQLGHVRELAATGAQPWATCWPESDGEDRAAADDLWLRGQRAALVDRIRGGPVGGVGQACPSPPDPSWVRGRSATPRTSPTTPTTRRSTA